MYLSLEGRGGGGGGCAWLMDPSLHVDSLDP